MVSENSGDPAAAAAAGNTTKTYLTIEKPPLWTPKFAFPKRKIPDSARKRYESPGFGVAGQRPSSYNREFEGEVNVAPRPRSRQTYKLMDLSTVLPQISSAETSPHYFSLLRSRKPFPNGGAKSHRKLDRTARSRDTSVGLVMADSPGPAMYNLPSFPGPTDNDNLEILARIRKQVPIRKVDDSGLVAETVFQGPGIGWYDQDLPPEHVAVPSMKPAVNPDSVLYGRGAFLSGVVHHDTFSVRAPSHNVAPDEYQRNALNPAAWIPKTFNFKLRREAERHHQNL